MIGPKNFVAATMAAVVLAGCVGPLSNSGANVVDGGGGGLVFPINADEADRVLATSMIAVFPSTPVLAMTPLPNRGYTATIGFLTDSHTISGIATPAIGHTASGERIEGFTFSVFNSGTMPFVGGQRAHELFAQINTRAATIRAPIPAE